MCALTGKLCFPSPEAAEKRRKIIKRTRGEVLSTFRCVRRGGCRWWHLGHV